MFLARRRQSSALQHQLRPVALSCCSSSTTSPSSTSITTRIKAFHVKDAEFNPTGRQGVYSGFQAWIDRAGRFRSLGDGQVDFGGIFSQAGAIRLRLLGRAGMGVLPEERRGRRARRRAVHRRPHHPRHRQGVRRFRRRRATRPGAGSNRRMLGDSTAMRVAASGSAWSAAAKGAFIGAVHRIAARLDDRYEFVAGALSATPEKARRSGAALGLAPTRSYDDFADDDRARSRAAGRHRGGGDRHAEPSARAGGARLPRRPGLHVICDKPLTTTLAQAQELRAAARASDRIFAVTYNYTGYPLVRHARAMIADGALGAIRLVQVRVRAGLADRAARGDRAEAGGVAHRSGAVGRRRMHRRHRHACLSARAFRHRRAAAIAARRSFDLRSRPPRRRQRADPAALRRTARAARCGRARSRPATRTIWRCASMARRAASSGARSTRTSSHGRRSASRRGLSRAARHR